MENLERECHGIVMKKYMSNESEKSNFLSTSSVSLDQINDSITPPSVASWEMWTGWQILPGDSCYSFIWASTYPIILCHYWLHTTINVEYNKKNPSISIDSTDMTILTFIPHNLCLTEEEMEIPPAPPVNDYVPGTDQLLQLATEDGHLCEHVYITATVTQLGQGFTIYLGYTNSPTAYTGSDWYLAWIPRTRQITCTHVAIIMLSYTYYDIPTKVTFPDRITELIMTFFFCPGE